MLYKLRNNANAFADKKNNASIFVRIYTISIPNASSYADVLSHEPQDLADIVKDINQLDGGGVLVTPDTPATRMVAIKETLDMLEKSGFIISGNTEEELNKKEIAGYRNN